MFPFVVLAYIAIIVWRSFTPDQDDTPLPEPYPIVYPVTEMKEAYADIIKQIQACNNKRSLDMAYVDIVIFQGNYNNSASFTSELIELYHIRENEIKWLFI